MISPSRCFIPRFSFAVVSLLAVLCLAAPAAWGQIVRIPAETAQSVTLSSAQEQLLDEFTGALKPRIFGENRDESTRAVGELLDPLRNERVSVAFRQAMTARLIDDLERVLRDARPMLEDGTINTIPYSALRIAGELATDQSLGVILPLLRHEDDGLRFFAIYCTEAVFFAVRTSAPAVSDRTLFVDRGDGRGEGLVALLGDLLLQERSPRHAAAIVRSLAEAGSIRNEQVPGLSAHAVRLIGDRTSERIRGVQGQVVSEEERLVWLTAGQAVQRVIAQTTGASPASALGAIRLGGHLAAAVYLDIEGGRVVSIPERDDDDKAVIEKQMLILAQNLMIFGEQRHAEGTGRRRNTAFEDSAGALLDAFLGLGDRNFRQVSLGLISANGLLTDAPYPFLDNEFIRE
jgi:hypothetical protein